ncbi:hypothetical protein NS220_04855 [Microbacterium testaceum]|uniref:Uncharacterized protein n=1 Tax=Microbacterium testaceum TaxID=2033 RepID=A0A147EZG4_MICTE|nr:hypothetical protein NS220_04855 [Microbacterium testaceum]
MKAPVAVVSAPLLGLVLAGFSVTPAPAHSAAEPGPSSAVSEAVSSAVRYGAPCGEPSAASRAGERNAAGKGVVQLCVDVLRSTPVPSGSPRPAPIASPGAVIGGADDDDTADAPADLALTGASSWVLAVSLGLTAVVVGVVVRRSRRIRT